jgi:hypothetical protein
MHYGRNWNDRGNRGRQRGHHGRNRADRLNRGGKEAWLRRRRQSLKHTKGMWRKLTLLKTYRGRQNVPANILFLILT